VKNYLTIPQNPFKLVASIFANYWPVLKNTWQLSLTLSLMYFVINSVAQISKVAGIALIIPGVLLVVLLNAFFWVTTDAVLRGQPLPFPAVVAKVKPRYFPMFCTSMLLICIILCVVGLGLGGGYLLFSVLHISNSVLVLFAMLVIAILLGLFIYLYFTILLVLLDNAKVLSSFKTSYCLVRKRWWHTFSTLFLFFLILSLVNFIATGSLSMAFFGDTTLLNYSQQNALPLSGVPLIILNICQILVMAIFYPAIFTAILVLFNDLKLRKKTSPNIG
jgi:hypothetical protein